MRVKQTNKRAEILLFPPSLEEKIGPDNIVRLIDAFVNVLDIELLGFTIRHKKKFLPGAPEYHPADLLRIYIYGYLNRTRSSRQLEQCCKVNIEMMWLVKGLTPGHVTIANFRKNNAKGLKAVFRAYNRFLSGAELFGGETIAIDGSKFKAQNSRKNNFSEKKINQHQSYIDKKTDEYLCLLDKSDKEVPISKEEIQEKLNGLADRKIRYDNLQLELDKAKEKGEKQISIIDSDARLFTMSRNKGDVSFNLQSAVDERHNLIIHNEITNTVDTNALYNVASEVKSILGVKALNVLADTGYENGKELKKCANDNITTYVSPRVQNAGSKNKDFAKKKFIYDKESDSYTCPAGQKLTTNGKEYIKDKRGRKESPFKKYRTNHITCKTCVYGSECASARLKRKEGKIIERYLTEEYTAANRKRVNENKEYYKKRKCMVEHPFGTIKRQWGYDYTLLKGLEKVGGEFNIICLCYNIRRSISILGVKELISMLNACILEIKEIFATTITLTALTAQVIIKYKTRSHPSQTRTELVIKSS